MTHQALAAAMAAAVKDYVREAKAQLETRLTTAELRLEMKSAETTPILATLADLTKENAMLRERVAILETRPPVPGPQGEKGDPGLNGKDGAAGLTYHGVWQDGKQYTPGDLVTWGGSTWHCDAATSTKPGDVIGAAHWTLMVKRGRDGRDGK